ncbi:recombination regulator RecX [Mumia sp. zg.B53]|uniref:regulatory protein RecX n=1 Tax=Mumia sp. zg.B53 TaxID=2855449 RepID=UPI001C6DD670|nr:regulatory protein RecX [Mumia sp. zg.B53]MBW9216528.1 recombination regulator RecX [Mumia sp. zg.B53]
MARTQRSGSWGRRDPEPDADRDLGPEPDHEAVARKILLDRLAERPRSRAELAAQLARRNVPDEIAERMLDRFEQVGLVDDEEFAQLWVRSRQQSRGLAGRALALELRRKGIDDEIVRDTIDTLDPESEEDAARAVVRKKLRSMRNLDEQVKVRRLVGALGRKGYGPGIAYRIVREEVGAADDSIEAEGWPDGP